MTPPGFDKAGTPAARMSAIRQSRNGGKTALRNASLAALLIAAAALGGCAHNFVPPDIRYDNAAPATLAGDPPPPVRIVELPKPLPLPGQLKPIAGGKPPPEAADPAVRVNRANAAARVQPVRNGFINAVQVYPFSGGALYQVYCAPGEITDIALQEGEQLVGSGPVAAGDTVRWIIGDTESGSGATRKIHILVKPTRPELVTNLVINSDRRTLPSRAALDREDLYGLGILAVPGRSARRAAPADPGRRGLGPDRDRHRRLRAQLPLRD